MNLSLYLIDDEQHALDLLESYINQTEGLLLTGSETHPLRALDDIRAKAPDLVLADIDMPQLNGLALAGLLPAGQKLVYTTSFREYGPEAYERRALDYLLKPISYERFMQSMVRVHQAKDASAKEMPGDWYIRTGPRGHLRRVSFSDVLYVESGQHYLTIQLPKERLLTYMTLSEAEKQLPAGMFFRLHKSFMVNWLHMELIEPGQVVLTDKHRLPIGRAYREKFLQELARRSGQRP